MDTMHPIRSFRRAHDLTLAAFAARVGVKRAAVSKWERGVPMSVESAKAVEVETGIPRALLRPDIYGEATQEAAE